MEIEENKWGLVRTNNGEWISEIHIEILESMELLLLKTRARRMGRKLEVHYDFYEETGEKFAWCYKNDIEELLNCQ